MCTETRPYDRKHKSSAGPWRGLHNLCSAEGPGAEGGPEGARGRLKWARCAWEKKKKGKKEEKKGKKKKEKEKKGKKEILIIEALLSIKKNVLYVTLW